MKEKGGGRPKVVCVCVWVRAVDEQCRDQETLGHREGDEWG